MLLDLSEIVIRSGMRVTVDVDQPSVEDPDLVFVEPLQGQLLFTNGGDLVNILGSVKTVVQLPCVRCLTEVRTPLKAEVEEHFPVADVLNPAKKPDEEFDTPVSSVVYLEQGRPILDLDELLRQLLVAELPMRVVCSEECQGLCPRCGANRNETPCGCEEEATNRPLAGLASLLNTPTNGDHNGA